MQASDPTLGVNHHGRKAAPAINKIPQPDARIGKTLKYDDGIITLSIELPVFFCGILSLAKARRMVSRPFEACFFPVVPYVKPFASAISPTCCSRC